MKQNSQVIAYSVDQITDNHFYISVQNGEVLVSAPNYLSKEQIQATIEEKRNWIMGKLEEYHKRGTETKLQKAEQKKCASIFGQTYFIKLSYKRVLTPKLTVVNKQIRIVLPKEYKNQETKNTIEVLLNLMYEKIARNKLESYLEKYRVLLRLAPEEYEIKQMKNVLAKCTEQKKIILHPELVKYEQNIIEYVILHQFCHLKYKTHSKKFYEMIERYIPDYQIYSAQINKMQY